MRVVGHMCAVSLAAAVLAGCNLRDAVRAQVVVVADAAGHELTVDRLAEISAQGKAVLLQDQVIERIAGLWVDYTLFAQRLADGDSLLDSATVTEAMWGEVRQAIVDHYHDQLLENQIGITDAFVDSVYEAGEHRIIQHILFRTPPDMSPPDKATKKGEAERVKGRLNAGRLRWEQANEANEDYASKSAGGSLGLISRGATVPQFENVAFGLSPGEISTVTETPFGYHIIRRPSLGEIRDQFVAAIEDMLIEKVDSTFLEDMEQRWNVAVDTKAPERMRQALEDLSRAQNDRKVIGTFRDGRFTVGDYALWLQTLDVRFQGQVAQANDAALTEFAYALMRNHVLVLEAQERGHTLTEDDLYALTAKLANVLEPLSEQMGLDSVLALTTDPSLRFRAVEAQVLAYLSAVVSGTKDLLTVPPFLARKLRAESDWDVSQAGVDRVVERAVALRAQLDSIAPPPAAPDSTVAGEPEP